LSIGEEVSDPAWCDLLDLGIEGLFRSVMPTQYAAWPPGSTTDGTDVALCRRSGVDVLMATGLTYVDFSGSCFPSRVDVRPTADRSVVVTGYIGEVDARTGAPPRLPDGTLVVPGPAGPELIVGRRQIQIAWTRVFVVP